MFLTVTVPLVMASLPSFTPFLILFAGNVIVLVPSVSVPLTVITY